MKIFLPIVFVGVLICVTPVYSRAISRFKRAEFYSANETACVVDNVLYNNGDPVPSSDPCEECICRLPGFACTLKECEEKKGCQRIKVPGECCSYKCGCETNNFQFGEGEKIVIDDNPCSQCFCINSKIQCTYPPCWYRSDCKPEFREGDCCPRYDHCDKIVEVADGSITPEVAADDVTTQDTKIEDKPEARESDTIEDDQPTTTKQPEKDDKPNEDKLEQSSVEKHQDSTDKKEVITTQEPELNTTLDGENKSDQSDETTTSTDQTTSPKLAKHETPLPTTSSDEKSTLPPVITKQTPVPYLDRETVPSKPSEDDDKHSTSKPVEETVPTTSEPKQDESEKKEGRAEDFSTTTSPVSEKEEEKKEGDQSVDGKDGNKEISEEKKEKELKATTILPEPDHHDTEEHHVSDAHDSEQHEHDHKHEHKHEHEHEKKVLEIKTTTPEQPIDIKTESSVQSETTTLLQEGREGVIEEIFSTEEPKRETEITDLPSSTTQKNEEPRNTKTEKVENKNLQPEEEKTIEQSSTSAPTTAPKKEDQSVTTVPTTVVEKEEQPTEPPKKADGVRKRFADWVDYVPRDFHV